MFRQYLQQNGQNAENIEQDINNAIEDIWNKKIFNVISNIYHSGRKAGKSVADMKAQLDNEKFQLSPSIMKNLYHAIEQGNPRNFYSSLGFAFEDWLAEYGVGPIIQKGTEFVEQHSEELINVFVSGALKSKASVVSGVKNIRSDILMTHYTKMDFQKDSSGVLRTPEGLPMELQSILNINWENAIPKADEIMSDYKILEDFLGNQGNIYGLSVKSWSSSNGKEFMKSSVLQKMLNATFNQVDKQNKRHSWQPDYTMEYVVYFLSHKIFDIIGPATIALTSRQGITWMDNFLTQHIFYMQVQLEKYWEKKDGGLGRVYPQITNSSVYVRNYNLSTAKVFKAKQHRTKKYGHYIDLKVT